MHAEDAPDITTRQIRRLRARHDLGLGYRTALCRSSRKLGRLNLLSETRKLGQGRRRAGDKLFDAWQRRSDEWLRDNRDQARNVGRARGELCQRGLRAYASGP